MEKDNKLIAEFMGYEVKHNKCYSPKYNDGTIAPMQFHKSWDWLMPVVVEIVRDEDYQNYGFREYHHLWMMHNVPYGCIDEVYEAVVTFIKSFNTKKEGE